MLIVKSYINNMTPEAYENLINPPPISLSLKSLRRSLNANLYGPLDDLKEHIHEQSLISEKVDTIEHLEQPILKSDL